MALNYVFCAFEYYQVSLGKSGKTPQEWKNT